MSAASPIVLLVPKASAGLRLDRFLAGALAPTMPDPPSRTEVKRWVDEGRVTVGEVRAPASRLVRAGDEIVVRPAPARRSSAIPEPGIDFKVLYMDEDLIVIDKPAGLVVHPAKGHESGTLVNGLLALGLFRAPADFADPRDPEGHLRPGIVHRLDAGTAGVMVVARRAIVREALKAHFAQHAIERVYEAICVGSASATTHATLHGRHPRDRKRFTTKVREGKRAVTHVEVVRAFGAAATHVRCRLETGRTHQIRVHLAESGTPILGDPLYGRSPRDPALRRIAERLGHQALVARVLGFFHPGLRTTLRFEVPLPKDFVAARRAIERYERARKSDG